MILKKFNLVKKNKIKLLRVVTQAEVIPWHLKNFIDRSKDDFDLYVVGYGVSRYSENYIYVTFIDCEIERKTSLFKDFKALLNLILICYKIKPQIMHSIMPKAGLLSAIAGFITFTPIRIHTFTGQVWSTKTGISKYILKFIDKFILILNTDCLTDSPSQSMYLKDNGFLSKGRLIKYLGKGSLSGVDLNRFNIEIVKNRNVLRKKLGVNENDFVFIFLARKSVVKGIIELFESFSIVANIPNVKLLFIGPDESNGVLKDLYVKHNNILNKIISLDIVKNHEEYLAISDVLCLPSSSEGFGSIVIEAAALGVPSIGFDIVGLSDSIEQNFSGVLVPFKDVGRFSEAMIQLYQDTEKLETFKINARERVIQYFSADAVYSFQSQFYRSLL